MITGMLPPDVEARLRRAEDANAVTAELLRRFEIQTDDRVSFVEAVPEAMAKAQEDILRWMAASEKKMEALVDAQIRTQQVVAELSQSVQLFLKARTNGGAS